MKATRITEAELEELKVASLPTRPTAPAAFGGAGYTAKDMKEAFDRLPLFLADKYNELVDSICGQGDDSIATTIKTGIGAEHALTDMFCDIVDGSFATYLSVDGRSLLDTVQHLYSIVERLGERLGINVWE